MIGFEGKPVSDVNHLRNMVAQTEVGKNIPVKVLREGKEKN